MPFLKNKTLLSTLIASLILSPAAMSSVSDMKSSGSANGYNLIEDSITSSQSNPGFVTNSLGSDNYSPKISLNGSRGKPAAIDLTNGTGSPAINLSRTSGYNGNISSLANNKEQSAPIRYLVYNGQGYVKLQKVSTHICAVSGFKGDGEGFIPVFSNGYYYAYKTGAGYVQAHCWRR